MIDKFVPWEGISTASVVRDITHKMNEIIQHVNDLEHMAKTYGLPEGIERIIAVLCPFFCAIWQE